MCTLFQITAVAGDSSAPLSLSVTAAAGVAIAAAATAGAGRTRSVTAYIHKPGKALTDRSAAFGAPDFGLVVQGDKFAELIPAQVALKIKCRHFDPFFK